MAAARQVPAQVAHVTDLLWPAATGNRHTWRRVPSRLDDGEREYLVLPNFRHPRIMIPTDRAEAWHRIRMERERGFRPHGWKQSVVGVLLKSQVHRLVPFDRVVVGSAGPSSMPSDLLQHVAEQTGIKARWMTIQLGVARPNQKPVLMFVGDNGEPVAYSKIGWNELTDGLVSSEGRALQKFKSDNAIEIPRILDLSRWRGASVLTTAPMPMVDPTNPTPNVLTRAIVSIAGGRRLASTKLHTWVNTHVRPRLRDVPSAAIDEVEASLTALTATHGDIELRIGAWHGDFRPWNVGTLGNRLLVWDWERYSRHKPLGLDAIHYHFPLVRNFTSSEEFIRACDESAYKSAPLLAALELSTAKHNALRACHATELLIRRYSDAVPNDAGVDDSFLRRMHDLLAVLTQI